MSTSMKLNRDVGSIPIQFQSRKHCPTIRVKSQLLTSQHKVYHQSNQPCHQYNDRCQSRLYCTTRSIEQHCKPSPSRRTIIVTLRLRPQFLDQQSDCDHSWDQPPQRPSVERTGDVDDDVHCDLLTPNQLATVTPTTSCYGR